jgi:hypothetical protein
MPDISKCENEACPLKDTCYRFTCKPNELWQSYDKFDFEIIDGKPVCKDYWEN